MISVTVHRVTFWCMLSVVVILSMISFQSAHHFFDWQDKLHHLLAYAVLFWFLLGAYGQNHTTWKLGILLAIFSGLIELAQSYTGYRQAEFMDLLANITGIFLVSLCYSKRQQVRLM